jgi:alpha-L-rhamnosidase
LLARFAQLSGQCNDHVKYSELAKNIKTAFNHEFYKGNGIYANAEMTALGCALYQGLVSDEEKYKVAYKLSETVKNNDFKVDFGILGAKYITRALADNGYIELAYRLITQQKFPGWVHWLKQGANTLWENWKGDSSRNHIMFGDIAAWMYQYLAGIAPDPEQPGFKHTIIKPHPVSGVKWVNAKHRGPYGVISSKWKTDNGKFHLVIVIPPDTTATIIMPDFSYREVGPGTHKLTTSIN